MAFKIRESLDTNVILRLILKDSEEQCLKVQDLLMRADVDYEVADLAIVEAVYVMQSVYGLSRDKIVNGVQRLLDFAVLKLNWELFDRVFPMYLRHPALSFNDCCLAVYAELNEAEPLWTFDKALAKQSGTVKLVG